MILCLETATPICSVALCHEGEVLSYREIEGNNAHSERITIFINEVMTDVNIGFSSLDAIAISRGPGSYTGLRIGVSTAKGICYATEKPLIAVDTLRAMAYGIKDIIGERLTESDILCPMIDARRMEAYQEIFDTQLNALTPVEAVIIDEHSYYRWTQHSKVWLFGDGADKCASLFQNNDKVDIISGFKPSARFMAPMAELALSKQEFVNTAYYEPFYLKDFVAGVPKVKGLR